MNCSKGKLQIISLMNCLPDLSFTSTVSHKIPFRSFKVRNENLKRFETLSKSVSFYPEKTVKATFKSAKPPILHRENKLQRYKSTFKMQFKPRENFSTFDLSFDRLKNTQVQNQFEDLTLDGCKFTSLYQSKPPTQVSSPIGQSPKVQFIKQKAYEITPLRKRFGFDSLEKTANATKSSSFLPPIPLKHKGSSFKNLRRLGL